MLCFRAVCARTAYSCCVFVLFVLVQLARAVCARADPVHVVYYTCVDDCLTTCEHIVCLCFFLVSLIAIVLFVIVLSTRVRVVLCSCYLLVVLVVITFTRVACLVVLSCCLLVMFVLVLFVHAVCARDSYSRAASSCYLFVRGVCAHTACCAHTH